MAAADGPRCLRGLGRPSDCCSRAFLWSADAKRHHELVRRPPKTGSGDSVRSTLRNHHDLDDGRRDSPSSTVGLTPRPHPLADLLRSPAFLIPAARPRGPRGSGRVLQMSERHGGFFTVPAPGRSGSPSVQPTWACRRRERLRSTRATSAEATLQTGRRRECGPRSAEPAGPGHVPGRPNINYTNVCIYRCTFCAFYRPGASRSVRPALRIRKRSRRRWPRRTGVLCRASPAPLASTRSLGISGTGIRASPRVRPRDLLPRQEGADLGRRLRG
jgi:hypothetical protein